MTAIQLLLCYCIALTKDYIGDWTGVIDDEEDKAGKIFKEEVGKKYNQYLRFSHCYRQIQLLEGALPSRSIQI